MFQESALFPWLTVERNVELALQLRKVPKVERRAKVDGAAPAGQARRLRREATPRTVGWHAAACRHRPALAQEAEVMLMDEPFGALDAMTRDVMHDELERIWTSTGLSVLFVTHNVQGGSAR